MVEEEPVYRQAASLDTDERFGWLVVIALPGIHVNDDDVVEKWKVTNVNVTMCQEMVSFPLRNDEKRVQNLVRGCVALARVGFFHHVCHIVNGCL